MRATDGPWDHPTRPTLRLAGRIEPGPDDADADGRPSAAVELRDRAEHALQRVLRLERAFLLGRRIPLEEIDEITLVLHRLQATTVAFTRTEARTADLADLRRARSSIGDALILTLDLLVRSCAA